MNGNLSYYDLTATTWWQVRLNNAYFNGFTWQTKYYAIIDSGTSLMYVPSTDLLNLATLISEYLGTTAVCTYEQCYYAYSCSYLESELPNI